MYLTFSAGATTVMSYVYYYYIQIASFDVISTLYKTKRPSYMYTPKI